MTIVYIDGNGDRQQTDAVRMVSSYPDFTIVYMLDGSKFEFNTGAYQNITCVEAPTTEVQP